MPQTYLIASYPKSGNTWLKFIMANLLTGTKNTFDSAVKCIPDINSEEEKGQYVAPQGNVRFFKSHSQVPLYDYDGVIYIYRHVCDVMVSFYFHVKKFYNDQRTIEQFFHDNEYGRLWNEALSNWVETDRFSLPKNLVSINYSKMLHNPFMYIEMINNNLSLGYSESQIREAIARASFASMQEIEAKNGLGDLYNNSDKSINFVREGKAGNYLQYISPELAEKTIEMNKNILNLPFF